MSKVLTYEQYVTKLHQKANALDSDISPQPGRLIFNYHLTVNYIPPTRDADGIVEFAYYTEQERLRHSIGIVNFSNTREFYKFTLSNINRKLLTLTTQRRILEFINEHVLVTLFPSTRVEMLSQGKAKLITPHAWIPLFLYGKPNVQFPLVLWSQYKCVDNPAFLLTRGSKPRPAGYSSNFIPLLTKTPEATIKISPKALVHVNQTVKTVEAAFNPDADIAVTDINTQGSGL